MHYINALIINNIFIRHLLLIFFFWSPRMLIIQMNFPSTESTAPELQEDLPCNIVDEQGTSCPSVVRSRYWSEWLLTGLQTHNNANSFEESKTARISTLTDQQELTIIPWPWLQVTSQTWPSHMVVMVIHLLLSGQLACSFLHIQNSRWVKSYCPALYPSFSEDIRQTESFFPNLWLCTLTR